MNLNRTTLGFILAISAAAGFGIMPIIAAHAYEAGANAITVVFFNFAISAVALFIYLLVNKINFKIDQKLLLNIVPISIIGVAGTTLTLFLSYQYIAVGLATILHYIYPFVVTLLALMLFKEKLNKYKIISLIMTSAGLILLIGLSEIKLNIFGILLALLSGILWSTYILDVGYSSLKNLNNIVLTFYLYSLSSCTIFIFGTLSNTMNFKMTYKAYLIVFLVCLVAGISFFMFTASIKIIGSTNAALLSTLEPITSIILGSIILKEHIGINTIAGSILIIIAVYGVIFNPAEKARTSKADTKTT